MPTPLLGRLVTTAALSWLSVRIALAGLGTVAVSYLGVFPLAAMVLAITWLDLRRSTELLYISNLAVSPFRVSTVVLGTAVFLEVCVGAPLADLVLARIAGA